MTVPDLTHDEWVDHIDHVNRIAASLARTPLGTRAGGVDELQSQGLVVLWELALAYNPRAGTFGGYLAALTRHRLVDWIRTACGREVHSTGEPSPKLAANLLDERSLDADPDHALELVDPAPGVEETVLARLRLVEVAAVIDEVCTPRQKEALLWAVATGRSTQELSDLHGVTRTATDRNKWLAKTRVLEALAERDAA